MKVVMHREYGPPEVLQIIELEKPAPDENQALVRACAFSLNPAEAHLRRGILLARFSSGLLRPKVPVLGADFAGRVEAVGRNVTRFKPGDEVFGRKEPGGFAGYICASEKSLAPKPAGLSFEEAAAIPTAGLSALQSLRDVGRVQPGQRVLINGAAGGLGTFAVQIAQALGAEVTGVTSTRNLELVRSLGAARVIDYTRQDFARQGERYDLIIDNVGNRSLSDLSRALQPAGVCVITGFSSPGLLFQHLLLGPLLSRSSGKRIGMMLSQIRQEDLLTLGALAEAGQLKPYIDRTYPLNEVREAYRYLETRRARGKIVVTPGPPAPEPVV